MLESVAKKLGYFRITDLDPNDKEINFTREKVKTYEEYCYEEVERLKSFGYKAEVVGKDNKRIQHTKIAVFREPPRDWEDKEIAKWRDDNWKDTD